MSKDREKTQLIIEAQEYKWRNYLRPGNIGRWLGEKLFGDYKDRMDALRSIDEELRNVALGNNVVSAPIKTTIKKAKEAYKNKKYIDTIYWLYLFIEIIKQINSKGDAIVSSLKQLGIEPYSDVEQEESLDYFSKAPLSTEYEEGEIKAAGLAQNAWKFLFGDPLERAYEKEVKKNQIKIESALTKFEQYLAQIEGAFDRMGVARSTGNVEDWISAYEVFAKIANKATKDANNLYASLSNIVALGLKRKTDEQAQAKEVAKAMGIMNQIDPESAPAASIAPESAPAAVEPSAIQPGAVSTEQKAIPDLDAPAKRRPRGPGRPSRSETEAKNQTDQLALLLKELQKTEPEKVQEEVAALIDLSERFKSDPANVNNSIIEDSKGNPIGEVKDGLVTIVDLTEEAIPIEFVDVVLEKLEALNDNDYSDVAEEDLTVEEEPTATVEQPQVAPGGSEIIDTTGEIVSDKAAPQAPIEKRRTRSRARQLPNATIDTTGETISDEVTGPAEVAPAAPAIPAEPTSRALPNVKAPAELPAAPATVSTTDPRQKLVLIIDEMGWGKNDRPKLNKTKSLYQKEYEDENTKVVALNPSQAQEVIEKGDYNIIKKITITKDKGIIEDPPPAAPRGKRQGKRKSSSEEYMINKLSHEFMQELKKYADDKYMSAALLSKFSEVMEDYDEDISIQLLAKAEELLND